MYRNAWTTVRYLSPLLRGNCLLKFVAAHVRKGDVVLDIGANSGDYSRMFSAAVGESGYVYAVEPNPAFSPKGPNVQHLKVAVSDKPGEMSLFLDQSPNGYASTLVQDQAGKTGLSQTITVPVTTIDAICRTFSIRPTFIKLDIEGAEEQAILGGLETLQSCKPILWFECWSDSGLQHLQILQRLGYRLFLATVIKVNGVWIDRKDPLNPRNLMPLDNLPEACDIAAIPTS